MPDEALAPDAAPEADAVPHAVDPEDDAYPGYRVAAPIVTETGMRWPIDEHVLTAIVATGTVLTDKRFTRRTTEV